MLKLKVFLLCLSVIIILFSGVMCMELYALERGIARGVYTDVMDDMQDIGYLHSGLADYYREEMNGMGWESVNSDYFDGSWPLEEGQRARKERNEMVRLTLTIRPSRMSQWINWFVTGETVFRFTGSRPSEYFDPGW
ncbi:hypothetical protein G3578_14765 [Brevibacillus sp. SYP-B805]|uniref:hypothetical protein n=1 Tax=Brevibacillus sp. SYP-B805 TaxID=1578199 RepID=UPI0013EC39DA|nr:hypothetical protein [Brevibacillus sp. SYP-B805]NGQ96423.1 hypothetical protein [Brevibacillus sp. SYP-B805]